MTRRLIISVTNDLSIDQRVHRVAMTLHEMGFEVVLVGRKRKKSAPLAPRPYATKRLNFWFESGKFFYLAYAIRMFWWLLWERCDVLLSNDMDTLLPNVLVAKLRGKPVIYDSHEYWTEIPELIARPGTRRVWLWLERKLFPRVNAAYTVNASIAETYQQLYGLPVQAVRNLPFRSTEPTASAMGKERILLYQGALNVGRGIELMIDAMAHLPEYRLVIAGFGSIEEELRAHAAACPAAAQIRFTGFIAPDELRKLTRTAMLGLSLEEDLGASYHFALPNKLFDYIQAGVPALVSDLPEMRAVVETHGVGEVLTHAERSPMALASRIRQICENVDKCLGLAQNCQQAALELNWENERTRVQEIFAPYL